MADNKAGTRAGGSIDEWFVAFNMDECALHGHVDGDAATSVGGLLDLQPLLDFGKHMLVDPHTKGFTFAGVD